MKVLLSLSCVSPEACVVWCARHVCFILGVRLAGLQTLPIREDPPNQRNNMKQQETSKVEWSGQGPQGKSLQIGLAVLKAFNNIAPCPLQDTLHHPFSPLVLAAGDSAFVEAHGSTTGASAHFGSCFFSTCCLRS